VADLTEVQDRSKRLLESLLAAPSRPAGARAAEPGAEAVAAPARFSAFDPEQAKSAAQLALGLSVVAADAPTQADGLEAALDQAESAATRESPELVHHALSLFITHSKDGRQLVKPRTATVAPHLLAPSRPAVEAAEGLEGGSTGDEQRLDFWREDPLANEHHEHWHEVYPFAGLLPTDWDAWAAAADHGGLTELLSGLDDSQDWAAFVDSASAQEIREAFLSRASQLFQSDPRGWRQYLDSLSPLAYGTLFHKNDRHGELFIYMHEQMLARYDTERLSNGLPRVVALTDFQAPIPEGYDPGPALAFDGFAKRRINRPLAQQAAANLDTWRTAVRDAVGDGQFEGGTPITRTGIGESIEGTTGQLRPEILEDTYPGLHNPGHMFISDLSEANADGDNVGVMATTRTAIRDPVFWRWHKQVDDLGFEWQEKQDPYAFADDAPPVLLRHSLGANGDPWTSPDLILCRMPDLPGRDADDFLESGGRRLGEAAFGGNAWDQDFTDVEVTLPDGGTFRTMAELRTEVKRRELVVPPPPGVPGTPLRFEVDYLVHEPFCYFLRVENTGDEDADVTVRIFIAPEELQDDRRAWIEMDKFIEPVPARTRAVIFRPDELSSVIKTPADKDPANLAEPGPGDEDGGSYCQCGWPYTLLLPRGTDAGMPFRLLVFLSDARVDQVPRPGHCGSMSYCGAADRYPDTRDMGYPFSRRFEQPIEQTFHALANAAGRSFTIKRS
jgi:Hemocyanin, ig-like domain/Hemocyanin, copper containing domain